MNRIQIATCALVGLSFLLGAFLTSAIIAPRSLAEDVVGAEGASSEKTTTNAASPLHVEHDEANRTSRITIHSVDGQIAWNDVMRGLARVGGLDDTALRGLFPDGMIDITKTGNAAARLSLPQKKTYTAENGRWRRLVVPRRSRSSAARLQISP